MLGTVLTFTSNRWGLSPPSRSVQRLMDFPAASATAHNRSLACFNEKVGMAQHHKVFVKVSLGTPIAFWSPGRMKSREHLWHVLCENRGDRKCMTSTRSKETSKTTIFLAIFCKFWSIEILLLKLLMMYLPMRQYQISNTTQYPETSAECKGNLEIIKSR